MHHVVLLQVTPVSSAHSTDAISPFTGPGQDDDNIKAIIRSKIKSPGHNMHCFATAVVTWLRSERYSTNPEKESKS